jgi:hypothetical protein
MFAPLRTACARHYFRHLGVDQQHPIFGHTTESRRDGGAGTLKAVGGTLHYRM